MENLVGLGSFGLFVTWIAFAVLGGMVGQRKGSGLIGTLLGLVLGPLGLALAIAMVGSRAECIYCRELVRWTATKCPHCHSTLGKAPPVQTGQVTFVDENGKAV